VYENGTLQELAELLSAIEALGDRIRLLPNRLLKEATPNMRMLLMILSVLVVWVAVMRCNKRLMLCNQRHSPKEEASISQERLGLFKCIAKWATALVTEPAK
jgi:hypothetical protein